MVFNIKRITVILLMLGFAAKGQKPEWQKKYNSINTVRKMFTDPPMFYAPHTFWFWDDTIRNDHFAASMAKEMTKQRLNPGYAHPRSSQERLNPRYASLPYGQYLEKPWFDSFRNAKQEAKNSGMTLGYCDEYDWPSGQAAGRVLKQNPELEAKYLDFKRHVVEGKSTVQYDSVDFAVAGKLTGNKIDAASLRLIGEAGRVKWTAPDGKWIVYTYVKKHHPGIDGGRVNYLDPKLMQTFIPIVHEQYAKLFKEDMGKTIPGVFVDNEGDFGWQMAWSEYLPQRYREMKNRDIRLWLPLLTEKDKDGLFAKARCDWFEVVSDTYNKCYFEPLVNWLNKYNMYYISNLWEESLSFQTQAVGDFMSITRGVTMPGTDCLQMKSQDVHDFKEVQTVAELEDRPFMSEIMGVAGWEQTPEMMKMTINSITSFGVNHVVPHGISVNRKVETLPFPADWFTENPYWPYLHYWTDFSRRASFVTRQSKLVSDVLLINPLESVWALTENYFSDENTRNWDPRSVETERIYSGAMREMNKHNIEFLIADKFYLNLGKIKSVNNATKLTIKDHDFSAMVLPPATIMSHVVSGKILEFAKQGGIVVILGELPQGSPEQGMHDKEIISSMAELKLMPNVIDLADNKNKLSGLVTALNERVKPQIRLENAGRLYTSHRKVGATDIYWLANNTDTTRHFTAWLRDGNGGGEIWNCETGEIKPVPSVKERGYNKVNLTLHPYEAYWLAFNPVRKPFADVQPAKRPVKMIDLNKKWTISYAGKDTVYKTMSKAYFSAEKQPDQKKMKMEFNDSEWKYSSFISNNQAMLEKFKSVTSAAEQSSGTPNYAYWRIDIPIGSASVLFPTAMIGTEIWIDNTKVILPQTEISLPPGAYLLSFAGQAQSRSLPDHPLKFVVKSQADCDLQSWYKYGLQQYTGYIDYETSVSIASQDTKVSLDLGRVKYMAEVFINDKAVGARLWPPFVFDISATLKKGQNKIRVRIGNLMVGDMWIKGDLGNPRVWGWSGVLDFDKYDAGLFGPVKLSSME